MMAVYYVGTILQSGDLKVMLHNDCSILCFVYVCGVLLGYSNKCACIGNTERFAKIVCWA